MKYLRDNPEVTVYGEIYGNTNRLKYGLPEGNRFAAFDSFKDNRFTHSQQFLESMAAASVPRVPLFGSSEPYAFDLVKSLAVGKTTVPDSTVIREGVVIRPVKERYAERFGRVILKSVSPDFLEMK